MSKICKMASDLQNWRLVSGGLPAVPPQCTLHRTLDLGGQVGELIGKDLGGQVGELIGKTSIEEQHTLNLLGQVDEQKPPNIYVASTSCCIVNILIHHSRHIRHRPLFNAAIMRLLCRLINHEYASDRLTFEVVFLLCGSLLCWEYGPTPHWEPEEQLHKKPKISNGVLIIVVKRDSTRFKI